MFRGRSYTCECFTGKVTGCTAVAMHHGATSSVQALVGGTARGMIQACLYVCRHACIHDCIAVSIHV